MLDVMAQGAAAAGFPIRRERGVPGTGDPDGHLRVRVPGALRPRASPRSSYHLRVLREAGLVSEETRGKWTFYALDGEAVAEALDAFKDLLRV